MELKGFISGLEKYYGEHGSKHVQKVTIAYVKSHYDEINYEKLLQSILKSHPFNFGFPDVCAIEDSQDKLYKRDGRQLRKICSSIEWKDETKPLTDKEREFAEPMRKDWNLLVNKMANKSQDKLSCADCRHFKPERGKECIDCTEYSNFEKKD